MKSRLLGLAIAFLCLPAWAQISVFIATAEDGKLYSACRAGQAGCSAGGSEPSGWTVASIGVVQTCEVIELASDNFEATVISESDEIGICVAYQTIATSADIKVSYQFTTTIAGTQRAYAGGGAFIAESLDFSDDYYYCWWPVGEDTMRFKHLLGAVRQSGQLGDDAATLAQYGVLQFDDAANEIECGEGTDGTNWNQIGSAISDDLTFPAFAGVFWTSDNATESNTFTFDNILNNTTLITFGGSSPPPDPDDPPTGDSDTPDYNDPVSGVTLLGGRTTNNVANTAALDSALPGSCGETIQLAAATYTGTRTLSASCPANNPVIFKGAANFTSLATARWTITGANIVITGIRFQGGGAINLEGTNNKVVGNQLTGWSGSAVHVRAPGTQGEIAYNEIFSPAAFNPPSSTLQFRQGIKVRQQGIASSVHKDGRIHHNWFHDFPQKPDPAKFSSGDSDAIELCTWNASFIPTFDSGWYIERNLVSDHLQSNNAAFDFKCGGVVVRYNTLVNVDNMRIDLRYGSDSILETNWIENGGSTVHHNNSKVVCNNYVAGVGIRVIAGAQGCTEGGANGQPRACETLISSNTGSLKVGHAQGGGTILPALNTTIKDHTGIISFGTHSGTVDDSGGAGTYTCPTAVQLNEGQVGPDGLPNATTAYKDARGL